MEFTILFGLVQVSRLLPYFTSKIGIRWWLAIQVKTHFDSGGELIEGRIVGNRPSQQSKFDPILQGDLGSGFIKQNLLSKVDQEIIPRSFAISDIQSVKMREY